MSKSGEPEPSDDMIGWGNRNPKTRLLESLQFLDYIIIFQPEPNGYMVSIPPQLAS